MIKKSTRFCIRGLPLGSPAREEGSLESGSPHPGLTCSVGEPCRIMQRLLSGGCCRPLWPVTSWLLAVESLHGSRLLFHCLGAKSGRSLDVTFEQRQVHFFIVASSSRALSGGGLWVQKPLITGVLLTPPLTIVTEAVTCLPHSGLSYWSRSW